MPLPCAPRRRPRARRSMSRAAARPRPLRHAASSTSATACRCTAASLPAASASAWDWTRWSWHFAEVDQAEIYASVLRFQLEEAVEAEDFAEAAALKRALLDATAADAVSCIMAELKSAIEEQRYQDASRLTKLVGTSLVLRSLLSHATSLVGRNLALIRKLFRLRACRVSDF
ncbi:uncharacterized protein [Aegilops tauschii subsp. strangulata]|nr:protein EXECUTER 2, chloroplastic [Aegilops tauschii subsp. strangulata]XP_044357594.1 protein EXECUTER 2, chloroplastic-like [Triticum aestivum]